jgi:hypothetical protein
MGLFDKLKAGLARTAQQFQQRFEALVEKADAPEQRTRAVDVDTLDALEELLIMADVGVAATDEIVEAVRNRARRGETLRQLVKDEILRIFSESSRIKSGPRGRTLSFAPRTRSVPRPSINCRCGPIAPASIWYVRARDPTPRPWSSTRSPQASHAGGTLSWSIRPGGCTRART